MFRKKKKKKTVLLKLSFYISGSSRSFFNRRRVIQDRVLRFKKKNKTKTKKKEGKEGETRGKEYKLIARDSSSFPRKKARVNKRILYFCIARR